MAAALVIAWTEVRMFVRGRKRPSALSGVTRANLLHQWAEGDRRYVERVEGPDGRELAPADVDWSTHPDGQPAIRPGRPVTTGRSQASPRTSIRWSAEEYERVTRAAGGADNVATWVRDVALARAK